MSKVARIANYRKPKCTFIFCTYTQIAKELCAGHYQQKRRGQPLRQLGVPRGVAARIRECRGPSCSKRAKRRGLCDGHYQQHRRTGILFPLQKKQPQKCTFSVCSIKPHAKGLCSTHYTQQRRGKKLTPIRNHSILKAA